VAVAVSAGGDRGSGRLTGHGVSLPIYRLILAIPGTRLARAREGMAHGSAPEQAAPTAAAADFPGPAPQPAEIVGWPLDLARGWRTTVYTIEAARPYYDYAKKLGGIPRVVSY